MGWLWHQSHESMKPRRQLQRREQKGCTGEAEPRDTGVQGEDTEQWPLSWDLLGSQLQVCAWPCCAKGVVYVLSNPLSPSLPLWRASFFIKDLCSLKSINAKLEWRVCKGRVRLREHFLCRGQGRENYLNSLWLWYYFFNLLRLRKMSTCRSLWEHFIKGDSTGGY